VNIAIVDPEGFVALRQGVFSQCGNRGQIDKNGGIEKQRDHQNWIYCVTSALEDPNEFMTTGTYTDLFFLDEATALSAGHRPCWQCNRSRHNEYVAGWSTFDSSVTSVRREIDGQLGRERADENEVKLVYLETAENLPAGTMVRIEGEAHLLSEKFAYPWSVNGYGVPTKRPQGNIEVLTPASTVRVINSGRFVVSTDNLVMKWT
jgi:hypothetical protein